MSTVHSVDAESSGWLIHVKKRPGSDDMVEKRRWVVTNGGFLLLFKNQLSSSKPVDCKAACGGAMLPAAGEIKLDSSSSNNFVIMDRDNKNAVMTLRCSTPAEAEKWIAVLKVCQQKVVEVEQETVENKENAENNKIGGVVIATSIATANVSAHVEADTKAALEEKNRLEAEKETMRKEILSLQKKQRASDEIIKLQQQKIKGGDAAGATKHPIKPTILAERLRLLSEQQGGAGALSPSHPAAPSSSSRQRLSTDTAPSGGEEHSSSADILRQEAIAAEKELQHRREAAQRLEEQRESEERARLQEIRRLREEADRIQGEEEAALSLARAAAELARKTALEEARAREETEERRRVEAENEAENARISLALATKRAADKQYEALLKHKEEAERRLRIISAAENNETIAFETNSALGVGRSRVWVLRAICAAILLFVALAAITQVLPGLRNAPSPPSLNLNPNPTFSIGQKADAVMASQGMSSLGEEEMEVLREAERILAKTQMRQGTDAQPAAGVDTHHTSRGGGRVVPSRMTVLSSSVDDRDEERALTSQDNSGNGAGAGSMVLGDFLKRLVAMLSPLRALRTVFSWFGFGTR